jgi:glutathione S-transferase
MSAPPLTLISHHLCPFVQRAMIVLLEKGVPFERVDVDLAAKPDWFLAISPMGKVPLLKVRQDHGAEAILFGSMAICEYLEDSQSGPKLYPADLLARAHHRAWIEHGSATLADAWQFLNAKDAATAHTRCSAFRDKLVSLEEVVGDGPYFAGETFSLVDAVFAPIFRYFDVLGDRVAAPIFESLPRVSSWRHALGSRPSVMSAVNSDYGERFNDHLRRNNALLAA